MKNTMINVLLFTTGAAIGSLVTWKVVKTKYERIIQEEIDSFKADYIRCMNSNPDEVDNCDEDDETAEDEEDDEREMSTYRELAHMYDQSGVIAENDGEGAGEYEVPYINGPYVITPEEFSDGNYDHSLYCLTYYADGVLSNDWYEQLDIDDTIGEDSLEHFGDHVEDVVYVRNERNSADYEVTRDPRNYADMIPNDPLMSAYAN